MGFLGFWVFLGAGPAPRILKFFKMVKQHSKSIPNILQILSILATGSDPFSASTGRHAKPNLSGCAKLLKTSVYKVRKVLDAYLENGMAGVESLNWFAGRPQKPLGLDPKIVAKLVCRETLRRQAGMSLAARCRHVKVKYDTRITTTDLRQLYRDFKITYQKDKNRLGRKKPDIPSR